MINGVHAIIYTKDANRVRAFFMLAGIQNRPGKGT